MVTRWKPASCLIGRETAEEIHVRRQGLGGLASVLQRPAELEHRIGVVRVDGEDEVLAVLGREVILGGDGDGAPSRVLEDALRAVLACELAIEAQLQSLESLLRLS